MTRHVDLRAGYDPLHVRLSSEIKLWFVENDVQCDDVTHVLFSRIWFVELDLPSVPDQPEIYSRLWLIFLSYIMFKRFDSGCNSNREAAPARPMPKIKLYRKRHEKCCVWNDQMDESAYPVYFYSDSDSILCMFSFNVRVLYFQNNPFFIFISLSCHTPQ